MSSSAQPHAGVDAETSRLSQTRKLALAGIIGPVWFTTRSGLRKCFAFTLDDVVPAPRRDAGSTAVPLTKLPEALTNAISGRSLRIAAVYSSPHRKCFTAISRG